MGRQVNDPATGCGADHRGAGGLLLKKAVTRQQGGDGASLLENVRQTAIIAVADDERSAVAVAASRGEA